MLLNDDDRGVNSVEGGCGTSSTSLDPVTSLEARVRLMAYREDRLAQKQVKLASAEHALASSNEAEKFKRKANVTKLRTAVLRLEATIADT